MTMPPKMKIAAGATILLVALGGGYALAHDEGSGSNQSTDDAYVRADYTLVAPKVAGVISDVLVEDNQRVKRGQLLARIDDQDFKVAVDIARADLAAAQADAAGLRAALTRQASVINQAGAAVSADAASVQLARANSERYRNLASDGSGTTQERDEADARLRIEQANQARDASAHAASNQQVPTIQADLQKALSAVERAKASLAAAQLNLSYTRVVAPFDGVIGRRSLRKGGYVTVGAPLVAVVPLSDAFVEANFRETQLRGIHPGQTVRIAVDTLPGVTFKGHVDSLAPASGVTFASIAPENATGNFTKIVQRVPVRISLDPGQPGLQNLKVGMSVKPTIDIAAR